MTSDVIKQCRVTGVLEFFKTGLWTVKEFEPVLGVTSFMNILGNHTATKGGQALDMKM